MPEFPPVVIKALTKLHDPAVDGIVLVASFEEPLLDFPELSPLHEEVVNYFAINGSAKGSANFLIVDKTLVPGGRLILSGTGSLSRDFDDVRRFQAAGERGMNLAMASGIRNPLLVTIPSNRRGYERCELVAALGALSPLYVPLNVRRAMKPFNGYTLHILPVAAKDRVANASLIDQVKAISSAFDICRDIGDQGPTVMTPATVDNYVKAQIVSPSITIQTDVNLANYPLLDAVSRGSEPAQKGRVITLTYMGGKQEDIKKTYLIVAKGVTMDTGGCDVKTAGSMFGMCRDKYGSAVLAGFFEALKILQPKGIKVIGYMCMVRNDIGSKAYTCDEVITARSGKKVHIYNTDYEGRLAMLDALTYAKEGALHPANKDPHIFTLATLTGHQWMTYGSYATVMDNGPAKKSGWSAALQKFGDEYGQPIEIARLHPEDYQFHISEGPQADVRQGNQKPSTQNKRGHQTPAAFLMMGSGIDQYGLDNGEQQIKFSHIDMAACMGDAPKTSYPNPLLALIATIIFNNQ